MTGPQLPRDEQGWRVPREHTLSWAIYRLAKRGLETGKIAEVIGIRHNAVVALLWKMRHPERANIHSILRNSWRKRTANDTNQTA